MPLLDLRLFTSELAARRNRAALLLTPDFREQRAYAEVVATTLGLPHVDLLSRFQTEASLSERLPSFSMADFFAFIASEKTDQILIVSGIEFILAGWLCQGDARQVKRDFCQRIEMWDDHTKPAFLLVAHQDPVFSAYQPSRYRGSQVVIQSAQTLSLS